MKIILVAVMSVNANVTRGNEPHIYSWTSQEDQDYFFTLLKNENLFIMGRKTYDVAKQHMTHKKGLIRVVLTKNPETYASSALPDMLEFTNDEPATLIQKLEERGFANALLLGGPEVYTHFIKQQLITEFWITIEPYIFSGKSLFMPHLETTNLELLSVEKLNKKGTLLCKYRLSCQMPQNQVK